MRPFERLRLSTASRDRVTWVLGGLRRLSCWHRRIRATTITSTGMSTLQLPPGLTYDGPLVETASGGAVDWVDYKKIKLYTNAFVISGGARVRSVAHRPPRIALEGLARLTFQSARAPWPEEEGLRGWSVRSLFKIPRSC